MGSRRRRQGQQSEGGLPPFEPCIPLCSDFVSGNQRQIEYTCGIKNAELALGGLRVGRSRGGRSLILNSQFSIIDAGARLGLLGCGARGLARAAGIQNAELELGGPRVGHRNAELEIGGPRGGLCCHIPAVITRPAPHFSRRRRQRKRCYVHIPVGGTGGFRNIRGGGMGAIPGGRSTSRKTHRICPSFGRAADGEISAGQPSMYRASPTDW